ncbi:MIP family channel protein [Nitzschia inconspicua]|uniref:MIP family channel protein n=1 Tax=Nitzschia inconspicua TaxID=303405 RepID=A0A9K3KFT3_9STRA|nr:MIP family channel protein [Nitzschia inconspicua]
MRYEQKTTMQSLAREQQLNQPQTPQASNYVHSSPQPKDDELSFMGNNNDEIPPHLMAEISLQSQLLAEIVGTYILVLIGCGAACVSFYGNNNNIDNNFNNDHSSWMMWAIGSMLGIYSAAGFSGGHLNPAITLAFCWVRPTAFSPSKVVPYFLAQILGATLASCTLLILFHPAVQDWEELHFKDIPSKCLTATSDGGTVFLYGVKSHVKACLPYDQLKLKSMSTFAGYWSQLPCYNVANALHATIVEAFGTAFVAFIIFSVTSAHYPVPSAAVPPVVALALGSMMYLLGPLTGDHLNPASEIGRRISGMIWMAWQHQGLKFRELKPLLEMMWYDVLPFIIGPLIGGPLGGFFAEKIQQVY